MKFVEQNKFPLITVFTELNSAKVYSSPIKMQVGTFCLFSPTSPFNQIGHENLQRAPAIYVSVNYNKPLNCIMTEKNYIVDCGPYVRSVGFTPLQICYRSSPFQRLTILRILNLCLKKLPEHSRQRCHFLKCTYS